MHSLDAITAALCKKSLVEYIKTFWCIVEPGTEYLHNWHIEAIAEHLEAVANGEIRNLLINMPPRCAKSLIVSVFWPTWAWITKPEMRWIFASYAHNLSIRDSLKCRRIIESPLYQRLFSDCFKLTSDQNTKIRFENDHTGYRIATSVGGLGTGEGGDFLVVDDPQSAKDAYSEKIILSTKDWWDNVMSTRGNDPKKVGKVIVMQRLADTDLSAHVLAQGGYEHLCLPMELELDRKCYTSIGWEDPRTEEGQNLWPERFDEKSLNELKKRLGSYGYAGQMLQRPVPKGGGMFRRAWFEVVKAAPAKGTRIRYWDRAATVETPGKDPDYTVGVKMCRDSDGVCYIEDIIRFRASPLGVRKAIQNAASQDRYMVKIGLEQDPGQAGEADVAELIRQLSGYNVRAYRVTKSKEVRATPLSAQAEAGNIKLVQGPWIEDFLKEIEVFPLGTHDDQVDAASGAFNAISTSTLNYEGLIRL